jgi:hypothetical protein
MDKPDSPEVGGASAANAGHRRNNRNTEPLADSATVVNHSERSLLEHNHTGAKLWAIQSGRRVRYLVEHGTRSWEFSLLWSAVSKFDRLSRKGAA